MADIRELIIQMLGGSSSAPQPPKSPSLPVGEPASASHIPEAWDAVTRQIDAGLQSSDPATRKWAQEMKAKLSGGPKSPMIAGNLGG